MARSSSPHLNSTVRQFIQHDLLSGMNPEVVKDILPERNLPFCGHLKRGQIGNP